MMNNFLSNIIMNDYIVHENLCNLHCQYCLGQDAEDYCKDLINSDEKANIKVRYDSNCNIKKTQDIYEQYIKAEIFQISGGELFMIENISEFIAEKSSKYEKVLVLTNGVLLNEKIIKKLAACNNISVAISLDGHTQEMNSYRFQSIQVLARIIENMKILIKYNIPIVINTVLHNRNIDGIKDFLYFLSEMSGNISVFPIILRGKASLIHNIGTEKTNIFLEIAEDNVLAEKLAIVPEYFREIYHVYKTGFKSFKCYANMFATETFNNGEVMCCPLNWMKSMGNIFENSPEEIFENLGEDGIYHLLMKKSQSLKSCRNCLSHYDVINMYLDSVIDLKTLRKVEFLNTPIIIEKIERLKKAVRDEK